MHFNEVIFKSIPGAGHCPFVAERLMNLPQSDYTLAIYEWAKSP
jgi:hypothetical protein